MSKGINFFFCKNKIMVLNGIGKLVCGKSVEVIDVEGKKMSYIVNYIIVVMGGCVKELFNILIDGKKIIEYCKVMFLLKQLKKMVVVGVGVIGVEFVYFYYFIGIEVIVVEFME